MPPRPLDGGTPTSRVGGDVALADAASSVWMIDSTSSILIRTFSGFKSVGTWSWGPRNREKQRTGVNYATTTVHVVQTQEHLFRDLFDEVHRDALVLMSLDEAEKIFAQDFRNHAHVSAIRTFMSEVIQK